MSINMQTRTLPSELFYYVVPHLDELTLLKSRHLSRRFRAHVDRYIESRPLWLITVKSGNMIVKLMRKVTEISRAQEVKPRAVIVFSAGQQSGLIEGMRVATREIAKYLCIVDAFQATEKLSTEIMRCARKDIFHKPNGRKFVGFGRHVEAAWDKREIHKKKEAITYQNFTKKEETKETFRKKIVERMLLAGEIIEKDGDLHLTKGEARTLFEGTQWEHEFSAEDVLRVNYDKLRYFYKLRKSDRRLFQKKEFCGGLETKGRASTVGFSSW
jgi:hypothetical protein